MNTTDFSCFVRRTGAAAALALGVAPVSAADAPAQASAAASAPKTHTLFVGADIDLQKGDRFHRIEDVTPRSIVARDDGKPLEVRIAGNLALRVSEAIKISNTSIAIHDLKTERAYTPGADPFTSVVQAAAMTSDAVAIQDQAARDMRNAESRMGFASAMAASSAGTPQAGELAAMAAAEAQNVSNAQQAHLAAGLEAGIGTMGAGTSMMTRRAGEELYDAIRVSFDIQPDVDIPKAHLALIAQIRERESPPGQIKKWVYVKSLGELSAGEKRTVKIYQPGLPPGFLLEGCEVHIYNGTEEFATSLSRRRVDVTDDQAHQFKILAYLSANKDRTLAPALVSRRLSAAARANLPSAALDQTVYARVSKAGKITGIFRDADARQPVVDAPLEAALQELRFNPALDAGKPVEGLAALQLRSLVEQ